MAINNQPNTKKRFVVDENGRIVAADGSSPESNKKSPVPKRAAAIFEWIIAIVLECSIFLKYKEIFDLFPGISSIVYSIIVAVLNLILVFSASLLWKNANRIALSDRPGETVSNANRCIYAFMSALSFFPFIIIILMDKESKGAPKIIGAITSLVCIAAYVLLFLNII